MMRLLEYLLVASGLVLAFGMIAFVVWHESTRPRPTCLRSVVTEERLIVLRSNRWVCVEWAQPAPR